MDGVKTVNYTQVIWSALKDTIIQNSSYLKFNKINKNVLMDGVKMDKYIKEIRNVLKVITIHQIIND
jgi:hypothetical protein